MKPWERGVLEYRPSLGVGRSVLSKINEQIAEYPEYKPTPVAQRAATVLASDVAQNLMASLSRTTNILDKMDKCLSNNPTYQKYREAKDSGDLISAKEVFYDNLKNINGVPQLDVIPILEDIQDEMESYLDFVNRELFDGQADYDDMDDVRAKEEKSIETTIRLEQEGKTVDYSKLSAKVKMIAACGDRGGWFRDTINRSEDYLTAKADTYVKGDIEGLLYHLDRTPEDHIPLLQQTMEASFRQAATQASHGYDNMARAGDRDFREMLDAQMASSRKTIHEVYDPLSSGRNSELESPGAEIFKMKTKASADQIPDTFEYMVVENITNTVLNAEQTHAYFGSINSKKEAQEYHKLLGLVSEEYDRGNPDKEIPRFIKTHRLDKPGSYCG